MMNTYAPFGNLYAMYIKWIYNNLIKTILKKNVYIQQCSLFLDYHDIMVILLYITKRSAQNQFFLHIENFLQNYFDN